MKKAIETEYRLHPQRQVQDYIKLAFQSEYGPGHLIADRSAACERLYSEWEKVKDMPREKPQDIGGGYVRLCIKGMDKNELDSVNRAFVESANTETGDDDIFLEKLELIKSMAACGMLPFTVQEAGKQIAEYLSGGIRPTSHTAVYHSHYSPAYRVVRADLIR